MSNAPIPSAINEIVQVYEIQKMDVTHGDGYIWLNAGSQTIKVYVREFFDNTLKDGDRVRGLISLHVYGQSIHGYTHLRKSSSHNLRIEQEDDSVKFMARLLTIVDSSISMVSTGTGDQPRISFSAVADVGERWRVLLSVLDCALRQVHEGDVMQGEALPLFNPIEE